MTNAKATSLESKIAALREEAKSLKILTIHPKSAQQPRSKKA
jgi:hypothetical protein